MLRVWRWCTAMAEARSAFGFCVPVFANPGAAYVRTPGWTSLDPLAAVDAAFEAEQRGFDSVWVADHLMSLESQILLAPTDAEVKATAGHIAELPPSK